MKKFLSIIAILCISSTYAQDSKLELIPYAGYTFNGRTTYAYAESDLKDAASYGIALDVRLHKETLVELMYQTMSTTANTTIFWGRTIGTEVRNTPLKVENYHIGGIREFSNEKVRPFTSLSLGATRFNPTGETQSSLDGIVTNEEIWTFSAAVGGGAKIMFNDRIGLRLHARLMMPMYFSGVGVYCGSGCGGGATFGVYYFQLDLNGGLIIQLGDY